MKIKPDSNKHDHKWTDLLKVGLFSILMSAPLISVGVKCGYVICNKNAYKSYTGYNENNTQYIQVDSYDDLTVGSPYRFIGNGITTGIKTTDGGRLDLTDIEIKTSSLSNADNEKLLTAQQIALWTNSGSNYLRAYKDGSTVYTWNMSTNYLEFTFTYMGFTSIDNSQTLTYQVGSMIYRPQLINQSNNLDNVFTYAVNELSNNSLFNWTQNTALYTGISAMTTNLEIVNPTIAILITYWTLLTIIYVIIDILLTGFIYLTHLLVKSN